MHSQAHKLTHAYVHIQNPGAIFTQAHDTERETHTRPHIHTHTHVHTHTHTYIHTHTHTGRQAGCTGAQRPGQNKATRALALPLYYCFLFTNAFTTGRI